MAGSWWRLRWQLARTLTGRRFRSVALVGRLPGERMKTDETWGCNFAYLTNPGLDRLYAMDAPDWYRVNAPEWFGIADAMGIPVIMKGPVPDIALSRAYDRNAWPRFHYEGTVSYMLADAIREGFGTIFLHRMVCGSLSSEYFDQKACLDWWAAFAAGLGIRVMVSGDSLIGRPHPWCSGEYGYVVLPQTAKAQEMIAETIRDIITGRRDPSS